MTDCQGWACLSHIHIASYASVISCFICLVCEVAFCCALFCLTTVNFYLKAIYMSYVSFINRIDFGHIWKTDTFTRWCLVYQLIGRQEWSCLICCIWRTNRLFIICDNVSHLSIVIILCWFVIIAPFSLAHVHFYVIRTC